MILLVIASIAAAFVFISTFNAGSNNTPQDLRPQATQISSFDECTQAGYPTLDSYPPQCETPDGKRFVQKLPEDELGDVTSSITTQGTFICLPHWDTTGPQTLECAFGLLDDSLNYYALRDPDPTVPTISTIPTDTRVEVTGTFIPGSLERHQSIGVIEVESVTQL